MSEETSENIKRPSNAEILFRLTRIQFIPLIILPALVGAGFAFHNSGAINFPLLYLTIAGVILLHLGANAIDDCYDFKNRVDEVANSMFPSDFGGWKPLPRQLISLRRAKVVAYSLFGSSLAIAALLSFYTGLDAFLLGFVGMVLAIFYTAPPLKLDYRGIGLGELAIFIAFGPIPSLGAYFVQTGSLNFSLFLISIPLGLLTVTILLDHDLIFYEVYKASEKLSLGTVLKRRNTLKTSLGLSIACYASVPLLILFGVLPIWSIAAPVISAIILFRRLPMFSQPNEPPASYVSFTVNALIANWVFALVLAISLFS